MFDSSVNGINPGKKSSPDMLGKISFIGSPAVGKTTLMKMLSKKQILDQYKPTQGFDLGSVTFNGYKLRLWDFGGQKAYLKHYLSHYIHGSDLVFVISDSTPQNVLTTKELIEHTQNLLPEDSCNIICLANKQDLPGHMNPKRIKDVLQIPTFGICAIDPDQRNLLVEFISDAMKIISEAQKI
ncbi:MAG: ADP-ribosylation factor-like protein [Promethearchaeota archaeon]